MENNKEKIADELLEKALHGDKNSFHELEKLAEDGNARAMSNLAQIYLKGSGIVESSYKKAVELFKKAAALDEVYALFRLGEFYRDAKCGFNQDGHKAAEYFIRAAERAIPKGATKCLRLAAEIYHYGKGGVAPDGHKAIELYKKLDEIESLGKVETLFTGEKALFRIAKIYTNGCGSLQPDGLKAIEYLNKAAERGDDWSAFYELANLYRKGKAGIKVDGYKVIEYLAKIDDLKGIAEIYRDGKYNVKADSYKAIEYLIKKAERNKDKTLDEIADRYLKNDRGHDLNDANEYLGDLGEICNIDTFQEIAKIYLEGRGGVQPDGQKALEYFLKADAALDNAVEFTKNFIEQNSDIKQKRPKVFSRIFHWSEIRRKNISRQIAGINSENKANVRIEEHKEIADGYKAIEYFEKNSDFEKVAEIYLEGKAGVEPNPQKAIEYFLKHEAKSSSNNFHRAEAFKNIAAIYSSLNDGENTLKYFLKADEFGDEWAYFQVAKIYREGQGNLKPDGVKLIEYLTKKLEQDESCANSILYDIAEAYEEGCGSLEPNMQKALEFYRKAAALGNNFAEIKLAKLTGSCK